MLISSWVLLGLEQRVKVPERTLDKVIGGHLCEPTDSEQQFIMENTCLKKNTSKRIIVDSNFF